MSVNSHEQTAKAQCHVERHGHKHPQHTHANASANTCVVSGMSIKPTLRAHRLMSTNVWCVTKHIRALLMVCYTLAHMLNARMNCFMRSKVRSHFHHHACLHRRRRHRNWIQFGRHMECDIAATEAAQKTKSVR